VKKDSIPGFINEAWTRIEEPGVYRGQCAELCGRAHGFMPIVVQAMAEDDYDQWLNDKKAEVALAKQEAEKALQSSMSLDDPPPPPPPPYLDRCAVCHQPTGLGIPGAFPAMKGSPVTTGDVHQHIATVVDGRSGTAMQAFGNQLSEKELAAVITYERNAWGNNTGDAV
ncbi:c-type cytochrome, partial [Vibrio parahaemolyticus]|uniref:c-type cytochrome n=1 Tax=Vibrio parahaemolyticus TaxID=670 RepID=UPI001EEAFA94|nr:c-type cytochrome [Vibrio parahaemolyticus]